MNNLSKKNKQKQVEPFIIFSFWMAILFYFHPSFSLYFLKHFHDSKAFFIVITQMGYYIAVLLPLFWGYQRVIKMPDQFTGKKHAVFIIVIIILDLLKVIQTHLY